MANPVKDVPKVEEPKKEEKKEEKTVEPVKDEAVKDEKPQDKPPVEEKTSTAKELRAAYDSAKKRLQSLEQELSELKKPKVNQDDPERKILLDKIAAEEARRKELETELSHQNFEKSEEYQQKFQKPFVTALQFAHNEIGQLKVEMEDGTSRPGTKEDFNRLLQVGTGDANKIAIDLFGNAAPEVMAHRRKILELNMLRNQAIEEYKTNREKIEQERLVDQQRQAKTAEELWSKTLNEQVEKYPQFFKAKDGDQEGNQILEDGFKLVDLVFSKAELPLQKRIELTATVRNKAAAFDRVAHENKKLSDRIAELENELKGYKESAPSGSEPAQPTEREMTWDQELDQLASKK